MELYRRNITTLLSVHRMLILIILLTATYLFCKSKIDYAVFCLIMLPAFLPFPITTMIVRDKVIIIRKFFFGFFSFTYSFSLNAKRRTIISITDWVGKAQPPFVDTSTLFDLLIWFYPRKIIVEKYLLIYTYHERNKKLQVKLTPEEHALILKFAPPYSTSGLKTNTR